MEERRKLEESVKRMKEVIEGAKKTKKELAKEKEKGKGGEGK